MLGLNEIGLLSMTAISIKDMSAEHARNFFLKHESYCGFRLPPYFDFHPLLNAVLQELQKKRNGLNDIGGNSATQYEGVNYVLQTNKDGHYAWRPFELVHPAIYVSLVMKITEDANWDILQARLNKFSSNPKIVCASLPRESTAENLSDTAETVTGWWSDVEQLSLLKALDFKYLFVTDISSFYPSIYTHSISWAVHTKEEAKKDEYRKPKAANRYLGPAIDYSIQKMRYGQTNGIPQGNVLMDFIAELVLGYADEKLTEKLRELGVEDYYIIRYRDDYRVFTNLKEHSEAIARELTLVLQEFGLQLNASKTSSSDDIILNSIKEDKREALALFSKSQWEATIQKSLLKLVMFSRRYPNSGQLDKQLTRLSKKLEVKKTLKEDPRPIISIITDIMLNNPRTIASCALVLSNTLKFIEDEGERVDLLKKIKDKFKVVLGTGVLDIWLQRISYPIQKDIEYDEALCLVVSDVDGINIWESSWVTDQNFMSNVMTTPFIDKERLEACKPVIDEKEVALFPYDDDPEREE
ncbi:RNA-directed DNA polymerase [Vibrio diabolicus]|uniref:RNA-directed DNA polymerase n=1 Tax=Vibrio diabolicus TaxID=50719 RepID=UPI003752C5CD